MDHPMNRAIYPHCSQRKDREMPKIPVKPTKRQINAENTCSANEKTGKCRKHPGTTHCSQRKIGKCRKHPCSQRKDQEMAKTPGHHTHPWEADKVGRREGVKILEGIEDNVIQDYFLVWVRVVFLGLVDMYFLSFFLFRRALLHGETDIWFLLSMIMSCFGADVISCFSMGFP